MIYLYYTDRFMGYNFGPEHPLNPVRLRLSYTLISEFGFLDGPDTCVVEPTPASEDDLLLVHTPQYLEAVKAEEPDLAFGLGIDDNPVFKGMYQAARLLAGGSIDAAKKLIHEDCSAFNLGGGLHHGMPTQASGFCIFNDIALAICILKRRFKRILYIDIDGHHGDGVQHIFYDDPQVLKISIHESGLYLFPGTGFIDELGQGSGRGYSVNIPMPMYSTDDAYCKAFEEIVPALFEWFRPEAVVAQLGVDTHYSDPLTSLNVTLAGYSHMVHRIKELTDQYAMGRLLALGGGGYSLEVVPIAWAIVFQTMRGGDVPEFLPPCWMEMFTNFVGGEPFSLPDTPIKMGEGAQKRMWAELENTLRGLKKNLSEIHGVFFV
jgi:acetoin utilization protein AcuC